MVKLVALPPTRTSPICPVAAPPWEITYVPPGELPAVGGRVDQLRRDQPGGRIPVDLVGLEEIQPPGDQERRVVLERGRARGRVGLRRRC